MMTMCLTFKQQIHSALIFVKSDRNDLQRDVEREVDMKRVVECMIKWIGEKGNWNSRE